MLETLMSDEQIEAFLEEYDHPDWVLEAQSDHLLVMVDRFDGEQELRITPEDVAEYYATQANNIVSGIRTLSGFAGDWRPINAIAEFALHFFKIANPEALRQESLNRGLEPKF